MCTREDKERKGIMEKLTEQQIEQAAQASYDEDTWKIK